MSLADRFWAKVQKTEWVTDALPDLAHRTIVRHGEAEYLLCRQTAMSFAARFIPQRAQEGGS